MITAKTVFIISCIYFLGNFIKFLIVFIPEVKQLIEYKKKHNELIKIYEVKSILYFSSSSSPMTIPLTTFLYFDVFCIANEKSLIVCNFDTLEKIYEIPFSDIFKIQYISIKKNINKNTFSKINKLSKISIFNFIEKDKSFCRLSISCGYSQQWFNNYALAKCNFFDVVANHVENIEILTESP